MTMLEKLFMNVFASSGQTFSAISGRHEPYRNFNFEVALAVGGDSFTAGFNKVSGLNVSTDIIEYRDGADSQLTNHKMPGLFTIDPVTFERGMSEDMDMWNWIVKQVKSNDGSFRTTISIKLRDRAGNVVKTWDLAEAWISGYETGELDAQGNGVMIDRMTVQCENITQTNTSSNTGTNDSAGLN